MSAHSIKPNPLPLSGYNVNVAKSPSANFGIVNVT
jgi:hypothetical protein